MIIENLGCTNMCEKDSVCVCVCVCVFSHHPHNNPRKLQEVNHTVREKQNWEPPIHLDMHMHAQLCPVLL